MSTPFFSTPERLAALEAAVPVWKGTPFCHFGAVAGLKGGASCHCLTNAVLLAGGFDCKELMPRVRVTWARQHTGGLMLPWFRARGSLFEEVKPVAVASIQPGDVVLFNLGEICEHHCGVAVPGDQIIHTLRHAGAHLTGIGDPWVRSFLVAIFRPLET